MHVIQFLNAQIQTWRFLTYICCMSHIHACYATTFVLLNEACQAKLCTNTSTNAFILADQMVHVLHTDAHTSFVLCDQMMRVAMKLVTSIQQCPIFCSYPYCVTVLLMLCKHISSQCVSVALHCSPVKYGCSDTLFVWEIIAYYEILRQKP